MKTSNKLLIALLAIVLLGIVGTDMVLKAEYEKIDFNDIYYGYSRQSVPPFKVVRLQGGYARVIQLQPGKEFEIRVAEAEGPMGARGAVVKTNGNTDADAPKGPVQWNVHSDTLELSYQMDGEPTQLQIGEAVYKIDAFSNPPVVYIMAPALSAVHATGVSCQLKGWQSADWSLRQEGGQSAMLLTNNTIGKLSATIQEGALLHVESDNQLGITEVQVSRFSRFVAIKDIFESVTLRADSTSSVQLPGSLFGKLVQP